METVGLYISIIFTFGFTFASGVISTSSPKALFDDQIARKLLIEDLFSNYDSRIAPTAENGGPANISIQLFISSIDTISETNMDFAVGMFLRQSWKDKRLSYKQLHGHKLLELDVTTMSRVWVPDLFIPSEKRAIVHDVTVPNKLMHIYPDGKIQYSLRLSATLKCNFDLRKFPMDNQHCAVEMESYGYTIDTMRFEWSDTPISRSPSMQIPQFFLQDITTAQCDKMYYGVGYSCVRFDIFMERSKGYYITQVYIPSYLIVFLSWVSFWLDIDAVPARISLGLLTVLTMTTQSAGARNNLPKVSYLKAIDVWMAMCLLFVFLALVQFAYVNVLSRVAKRRTMTSSDTVGKLAIGTIMPNTAPNTLGLEPKTTTASTDSPSNPFARQRKLGFGTSKKDDSSDSQSKNTETDVEIGNGAPTKKKASFANLALRATTNKDEDDPPMDTDTELKQNQSQSAMNAAFKRKQSQSQKGFSDVVKLAQGKMSALVSTDRTKARNADRMSRVLFPLSFLIFNIIYWCVYIFWQPTSHP